jgi:hypothetical protein
MYRIKDRVELQLFFNGEEFPFNEVNAFDFIHMSCSTKLGVPMIHLRVKDTAQWLAKKQSLVDGAIISVTLDVHNVKNTYRFRLNTHKEQQGPTGPVYEIDGYFDAPEYWLKSVTEPHTGTSNSIISSMASKCRLKYDGTNTSDNQTWWAKNRKVFQFCLDITKHGYANDGSCMQLGLDLDGILRYRNVAQTRPVAASFVVGEYHPKTYVVTDFAPRNLAGMFNSMTGYAEEVHAPSVFSPDLNPLIDALAKKLTTKMMMNSDVKKTISRSRVIFKPIDCGNVHPQYDKAYYQNMRLSNLYSFGLDAVTPDYTTVRLFDYIDFSANEPSQRGIRAYSGKYIVASRAIYVTGANYYEKFEFVRQGVNASVDNQL